MASDRTGQVVSPGEIAGITEAMITQVVHGFYRRVRADAVLGPIFAAAIPDERWPQHLDKMVSFWGSVLLMTGAYHGRPVPAHQPLPIGRAHFEHWLGLFAATVRELCPDESARLFLDRAERIANSLHMACMLAHGRHDPAGSPLVAPLARPEISL